MESACWNGGPPLYEAAKYGHVNVMLFLLRAKADAMHCNSIYGWSALSVAASAGHTAAARCLLQHAPALADVATRVYVVGPQMRKYRRAAFIDRLSMPLPQSMPLKCIHVMQSAPASASGR